MRSRRGLPIATWPGPATTPSRRRSRSTPVAPTTSSSPSPVSRARADRSTRRRATGVRSSGPARTDACSAPLRPLRRSRWRCIHVDRRPTMSQLVADYILERLKEWGIHRIYGYPGDGINALLGAFDRADGDPELIQVRHEEMAAFMACGHAKFGGQVGVCMATSGPGAIHLLNGLYDAKLDHQPVVAIVGQQARSALGGDYQQEVDLISLFKDVAHENVYQASVPEQTRHLVDRAMRIAKVERTVTCLVF